MKAKEALILWDTKPTPRVKVTELGNDDHRLLYSGGAAYVARREWRGKRQLEAVLFDFFVLTVEYGIDAKLVHQAFLSIDEYREALKRGCIDEQCGLGT